MLVLLLERCFLADLKSACCQGSAMLWCLDSLWLGAQPMQAKHLLAVACQAASRRGLSDSNKTCSSQTKKYVHPSFKSFCTWVPGCQSPVSAKASECYGSLMRGPQAAQVEAGSAHAAQAPERIRSLLFHILLEYLASQHRMCTLCMLE